MQKRVGQSDRLQTVVPPDDGRRLDLNSISAIGKIEQIRNKNVKVGVSPRRTFLLQSSAVFTAMVGGCSRNPFSRNDLSQVADLAERFFHRTKERLDDTSDDLAEWLQSGSKPKSKPPFTPPDPEMAKAYAGFIDKLELRHIHSAEVLRAHYKSRDGVSNSLPPEKLWEKMAPTLKVADEIRHRLGKRMLSVSSAYRSPAYNAACPGAASRSYHMKNCALDLRYDCSPAAAAEIAETLREEKFFKGGIGLYKGFVHIDTRGYNVNWEA